MGEKDPPGDPRVRYVNLLKLPATLESYETMKKTQKKKSPKKLTPSKPASSKRAESKKITAVKAKHQASGHTGDVGVPEKKKPSKAQIVRELPLSMSAREVIAHAKKGGVDLQESYVYNVRTAMKMKRAGNGHIHVDPVGADDPRGLSRAEELLISAASEVGLPRALEVLEGMRAPLSEFLSPLLG